MHATPKICAKFLGLITGIDFASPLKHQQEGGLCLYSSSRPGALTHASVPHPACGVSELQWMKVANSFELNLTLQSLDPWDMDHFACAEVRSHEVHISKPARQPKSLQREY